MPVCGVSRMSLKVYNTLTRRKEDFVPLDPPRVSIYVCGITPYARSHVGHARPSVFWDVVRRYLTYLGYSVDLVQNFTDIDDKILQRSKETGLAPEEIAEVNSRHYLDSMRHLNVIPARSYPRATEFIGEIVRMTEGLLARGHAYVRGGDVYFRASSFSGYGALSGKNVHDLLPGARVEVSGEKESPLDWALWKSVPDDEPGWESPWGRGRPGWHIECSAMVTSILGSSIDMHGGGTELIFPHHENEIAQAESFTGVKPFVRYWVHHEMLNLQGEKMSKSTGNVIDLEELLTRYPPEGLRVYLLSAQRRKMLDFSTELLESSVRAWEKVRSTMERSYDFLRTPGDTGIADLERLERARQATRETFFSALDDDFNTALALSAVFDLVSALNSALGDTRERSAGPEPRRRFGEAFLQLMEFAGILGLLPDVWNARREVLSGLRGEDFGDLVEMLVRIREEARSRRDWGLADQIRMKLQEKGIVVQDEPGGTRWSYRC